MKRLKTENKMTNEDMKMLSIQRETLNEVRTLRLGLSSGAEGAFNPKHKSFWPRFLSISYMMT